MILSLLIILLVSTDPDMSAERAGTIQGVVVNGTHGDEPIGYADVVLRAGQDGHLEPIARTKADASGKFAFDHIPAEPGIVYLPGADHKSVHYPGKRIQLDQRNPIEQVTIRAFDAVESPSPLEAMRHDIDVNVGPQVMTIRETILIVNSSCRTYVGEKVGDEALVTLRLSIPANFDRVTFGSEFYGRRFRIVDHQLVTDIPWPPGERELNLTYRIPLENSRGLYRRPFDIPCSKVTLRVQSNDSVSCNFPIVRRVANETVFSSIDKELPAGRTIELQIGKLPVSWGLYARCAASGALIALILGSIVIRRRRGLTPIEPPETALFERRAESSLKRLRRVA